MKRVKIKAEIHEYIGEGVSGTYWRLSPRIGVKVYFDFNLRQVKAMFKKYLKAYKLSKGMTVRPIEVVKTSCDEWGFTNKYGIRMEHADGKLLAVHTYHSVILSDPEYREGLRKSDEIIDEIDEHLRTLGIIHGDLHIENIVLIERAKSKHYKVIDLDDARFTKKAS